MTETVQIQLRNKEEDSDNPLSQISDDENVAKKKPAAQHSRRHKQHQDDSSLDILDNDNEFDEEITPNNTAFVIPECPPLPRMTKLKNWDGVDIYPKVTVSKTVDKAMGAKGRELMKTANERIEAMGDSCDSAREIIGEIMDEAKTLIGGLHKKTKDIHKELVKALRSAASEKNKAGLAKQSLAASKSNLTKANREIKSYKDKIDSLEIEKASLADKLQKAKEIAHSADVAKAPAARGGGNKLSPELMLRKKKELRIEEYNEKMRIKQEADMKNREHIMKCKRDRTSDISTNLLSLSNGGFVSYVCFMWLFLLMLCLNLTR